jgi:histidyl-tRNA synthetase
LRFQQLCKTGFYVYFYAFETPMKPSIPRGTRDFGPAEMQKRQYIFDIIKRNFQLFGYAPIETPTMENLDTLTGKYGDEGDKLIFKILNSGNYLEDGGLEWFKDRLEEDNIDWKLTPIHQLTRMISEKALRYDLTVPFARYVVMNHHKLSFPFKRYQIQPVWRADRPQKGRYREFYQCDVDVIGSDSLINELELVQIMVNVFARLGIHTLIKINNRKILSGIAEVINEPEKIVQITVAIDKLDKIGIDGVNKELRENGISDFAISKLEPLFQLQGNRYMKLEMLRHFLSTSEIGLKGIIEVEQLFALIDVANKEWNFERLTMELDITLARGLNYYTGTIFEVKASEGNFSPSILGGGRYDDLTGVFGLKGLSGVGISFGVDRIYDVMEELNLFPQSVNKVSTTKILLTHFGEEEKMYCISLAAKLRSKEINTEVYPDNAKIRKQFDYADKKQIPFVVVVGSDEMAKNTVMLKDMSSGLQEELSIEAVIEKLS